MRKSAVRVACPLDEALTAAWTDWFWSTREPSFTFVLFYRDDVLCWLLLARPFLYAFHAHLRFPVDLVWFRLSCDHGWIRSGSVNVRKQQQQQLLEAAPHGDGGCLGGGDGNVQVDGMCNQYLIVLMMLFARQFDCMAGCCCVGLTKAVRDGREGDLGHR